MPPEVIKINNDTRMGITRYPNGAPESKITYVNGKSNGVEIWWWDNGQKRSEIMWEDGKRHGLARAWRESGEIWYESMTYKNNKVYDAFTSWYRTGTKERESHYRKSVELARIEWDTKKNITKMTKVHNHPPVAQQQQHTHQKK